MNKLVLFGAGKIGRSFIGQLFSASGYEVVFVDINKPVIEELNRRKEYKVVIKSKNDEIIQVKNVRGIHFEDHQAVINELTSAQIAAVSVGKQGLIHLIPMIAKALEERLQLHEMPLDIIIAENMQDADLFMKEGLKKHLPAGFPLDRIAGLVETSIGKMVPIMPREEEEKDILQVYAEPYNALIIDKKAFRNPIPEVAGLSPKVNIKAWVERKSYIQNFGYEALSYIAYLYNPNWVYLYEALAEEKVKNATHNVMQQAGRILQSKHPGEFSNEHISEHINDLLERFSNKALGDTIFRAGCDLKRKLSKNDRVCSLIYEAQKRNLNFEMVAFVMCCGFKFKAINEQKAMFDGDIDFHNILEKGGFRKTYTEICNNGDVLEEVKMIELERMYLAVCNDFFGQLKKII